MPPSDINASAEGSSASRDAMSRLPVAVPKPWPAVAAALAIALMLFGVAWEWFLDPLRPGGSWMALKVLPLAMIIPGLARGRMQTFRVASLLIWIYVGEALVRVMGLTTSEQMLATVSLVLSTLLAVAILMGAKRQIGIMKAMMRQPEER